MVLKQKHQNKTSNGAEKGGYYRAFISGYEPEMLLTLNEIEVNA